MEANALPVRPVGTGVRSPLYPFRRSATGAAAATPARRRGQVSPLPYVDLTLPGDMRGMQRAGAVRTLGKQQRGVSQQNFEHPPANAAKKPSKPLSSTARMLEQDTGCYTST